MKKEMEKDTRKRDKDVSCLWTGRTNTVKIIILPKAVHRCGEISIKIHISFFTEIGEKFPKIQIEPPRVEKNP